MDRRGRWMAWVAAGAAAVVGLSGCVGDEEEAAPSVLPITPSSVEPVALDLIATETTKTFVSLVDRAFAELEVSDELRDITTAEIASNIAADVEGYVQNGYRLEGRSLLANPTVTELVTTSSQSGTVAIMACLDTSESRVVTTDGLEVTGGEVERRPVTFEVSVHDSAGTVTATAFPGSAAGAACES